MPEPTITAYAGHQVEHRQRMARGRTSDVPVFEVWMHADLGDAWLELRQANSLPTGSRLPAVVVPGAEIYALRGAPFALIDAAVHGDFGRHLAGVATAARFVNTLTARNGLVELCVTGWPADEAERTACLELCAATVDLLRCAGPEAGDEIARAAAELAGEQRRSRVAGLVVLAGLAATVGGTALTLL